jgi:hypothetical protein
MRTTRETHHAHPAARAAVCTLALAAVGLVGLLASPVSRAADVGVSISVSQPGVYGRIDIGRFPQPELIVAQPVVVHRPRVVVAQPVQPVYLWVPPGHQKNWSKHCSRYNACGTPVYFVKEEWYRTHVSSAGPAYSQDHGDDHPGKGKGKGKGHGHD